MLVAGQPQSRLQMLVSLGELLVAGMPAIGVPVGEDLVEFVSSGQRAGSPANDGCATDRP
jgi:hypothetical protein